MKLSILIIFVILFCFGCEKKPDWRQNIEKIDSIYTLNLGYDYDDVRRYGLFPNKPVGTHPKILKNKMDVIIDLSAMGLSLKFPKGQYNTSLRINNRNNISFLFKNAIFSGPIEIKNSKEITFKGSLTSMVQLYTRDSEKLDFEQVLIKSDTLNSINNKRPYGCSIHSGTKEMKIGKIEIEDVGSKGSSFKYVKGGLIVHGHNNEPENITIDSVIVRSSDRHGVYLSGDYINIKYISIEKFGVGSNEGMAPMEGGEKGNQSKFTGLWIKNCYNSNISFSKINLANSKGTYSFNFDYGESFRPVLIDTIVLEGTLEGEQLSKRYFSRTGVKVNTIIE